MPHRRAILKWLLIVVIAFATIRYVVFGKQVGSTSMMGLTTEQVRMLYGPPSMTHHDNSEDEDDWVYYRGLLGGGTGLTFKRGVDVDVEVRYSK